MCAGRRQVLQAGQRRERARLPICRQVRSAQMNGPCHQCQDWRSTLCIEHRELQAGCSTFEAVSGSILRLGSRQFLVPAT
jgi:hypothetical protein